jgi:hypothetical protein
MPNRRTVAAVPAPPPGVARETQPVGTSDPSGSAVYSLAASTARLSVCRLSPNQEVPAWATAGQWWSVTRSQDELSITCHESLVPPNVTKSGPWRALVLAGPLDHSLVGVLASISAVLADARVPIFTISTFETDHVLVPADQLEWASAALRRAGHVVEPG